MAAPTVAGGGPSTVYVPMEIASASVALPTSAGVGAAPVQV